MEKTCHWPRSGSGNRLNVMHSDEEDERMHWPHAVCGPAAHVVQQDLPLTSDSTVKKNSSWHLLCRPDKRAPSRTLLSFSAFLSRNSLFADVAFYCPFFSFFVLYSHNSTTLTCFEGVLRVQSFRVPCQYYDAVMEDIANCDSKTGDSSWVDVKLIPRFWDFWRRAKENCASIL